MPVRRFLMILTLFALASGCHLERMSKSERRARRWDQLRQFYDPAGWEGERIVEGRGIEEENRRKSEEAKLGTDPAVLRESIRFNQ